MTRRYSQLTEMMKHHNFEFDERKYWSYGCNCLILGILIFHSIEIIQAKQTKGATEMNQSPFLFATAVLKFSFSKILKLISTEIRDFVLD